MPIDAAPNRHVPQFGPSIAAHKDQQLCRFINKAVHILVFKIQHLWHLLNRRGVAECVMLLLQLVVPVMNDFKEIETCLECSAKKLIFVSEVFYYALKAVLHPTAALFSPQHQTLKPLCIAALKRIFKMCDKDQVVPAHLTLRPRLQPAIICTNSEYV